MLHKFDFSHIQAIQSLFSFKIFFVVLTLHTVNIMSMICE